MGVRGLAFAGGLHFGVADAVVGDEVLDEAARLDVVEDALHLRLRLLGDDARAGFVVAIFGGVADRIAHIGDAALVHQVDDQLHLVQALEIGHFGRVARFGQRLEPGHDEVGDAAAKNRLLPEQVGLAFLAEIGFDDARTAAADRAGVAERQIVRVARRVLFDGDEAGHAAAAFIFAAHGMTRPLRRDHDDVEVLAWFDQAEMHVKPVREGERGAVLHMGRQFVMVDLRLMLVGRQHHDHVGPFRRLGVRQNLEPGPFRLGARRGAFAQRDRDIGDAGNRAGFVHGRDPASRSRRWRPSCP